MSHPAETRVVVLGASPKSDRYSNRAVVALLQEDYDVVPVHPAVETIQGLAVAPSLEDVGGDVDTVTVYVNAARSSGLEESLKTLSPRRVIFNPGAENPELAASLEAEGVEVEEACTLVLLASGQF